VAIYNDLVEREIHPLIIGTWFHHSFVSIHPFQDGNGRVARLLTSLIFIKYGFFPITVRREEKVIRYFQGLREADVGKPQTLVDYFGEVQRRGIEKALNVREITPPKSFAEMHKILVAKAKELKEFDKEQDIERQLENNKSIVFEYCGEVLIEFKNAIKLDLNGNAEITIKKVYFDHSDNQYYKDELVEYAKEYNYEFEEEQAQSFFYYDIKLFNEKEFALGVSLHNYGYEMTTMAMASFFELKQNGKISKTFALELPPQVFSLQGDIENKKKNIKIYLEKAMLTALSEIASRMTK